MTLTGTRTMHVPHPRDFRFDPRLVVAGLILLGGGTVFGFAMAGQAQQAADNVAAPVAALCQQGGPTGAKLADTGACAASANTGVGPFQSDIVAGPAGGRGAAGAPGADSLIPGPGGAPGLPGAASTVPGTQGNPGAVGTPGATGVDGVSPACLSEPTQCRGVDGAQGSPGKPGEPGAPGAPGQAGAPGAPGADGRGIAGTQVQNCRLIVTYTDGTSEDAGQVCTPAPDPGPEPTQ